MKNKKKLCYFLIVIGSSLSSIYAQESSNTSGGDASGTGGTVAYSIGQTVYSYNSGSNGNSNQGIQQTYIIQPVGLNEQTTNISLKTFPNPTTGYLTLVIDDFPNRKMDYKLIDMQGKEVLKGEILNEKTTFDLSPYKNGTYFISINKKSNEIKKFKIIKN